MLPGAQETTETRQICSVELLPVITVTDAACPFQICLRIKDYEYPGTSKISVIARIADSA